MSNTACVCDNLTFSNTGNQKTQIQKVTKLLFLVPLKATDGTEFNIDLSDTLDQDYLDDLINHADPTKRIYPLNELETIGGERAANEFKTYASGTKIKVKDGVRSFSAEIPNRTPQFLSQLESWTCKKFGVLIVDKCNALIGRLKSDGKIYPLRVQEGSWNPTYVFGNETEITGVNISFDFHESMKDSEIGMITDATADWLASEGLTDVTVVYSAISVNGFTMTLSTPFGLGTNNVKVEGLLITDMFDVAGGAASKSYRTNNTPGAIDLATVTEGDPGVYAVVLDDAADVADVIRNTPVKNGFDFSAVVASPVTITA